MVYAPASKAAAERLVSSNLTGNTIYFQWGVFMAIESSLITMKVADLIPYDNNPRVIPQAAIDAVRESFKQCQPLDPIEVDENNVILSGHTRRLAAMAEGIKELRVIRWTGLTEEQKIKYRLLANKTGEKSGWEPDRLEEELSKVDFDGFDFGFSEDLLSELEKETENPYSTNVKIPHYDVTGAKPRTEELCDMSKVRELIVKIDASGLPDEEKEFLRAAAYRHAVFNYRNIAEYYANSGVEMQELMEDSALVIIDIDDAIAKGYAKLEAEIEAIDSEGAD